VGATDANFAFFPECHVARWIVNVGKLDGDARNWNPARAWLHSSFKWCKCTGRRGFSHTPAFGQPAAGDILKALLHLQRERGPSRSAPFDRRQIEIFDAGMVDDRRSEEHTSELQSRSDLVCRLLLEK